MDLRRGGVYVRVSRVTTLPYLTARADYDRASSDLLRALLSVYEERIRMALLGKDPPDISPALAWLTQAGRHDLAKNLIDFHESFFEAKINLSLALHREEYDAVVEGRPEYLEPEEGVPSQRYDEEGYPLP